MAQDTVIARRYAKALYDLAVAKGRVDAWQASLDRVLTAAEQCPALLSALGDAAYPVAQRLKVIDELGQQLGCELEPIHFLKLLIEKRRITYLTSIIQVYRALVADRAGIISAAVTTALPLMDGEIITTIQRVVGELKQKQVHVESHVDPDLIGGIVIRIGDEIYDGSVAAELRKMREQLLAANG